MEKYNDVGASGCDYDAYGNELQEVPAQTFPTEMFHHTDFHYNSASYTASNGIIYQADNQQHGNNMLNYSRPIIQQPRQQLVVNGIYSEGSHQQHQTSFLDANRSGTHPEAEHQQKPPPHLTAHYGLASTNETSQQITERQYRLIRAQNTQQLQRPSNTMAPDRLRQLKHQYHELEYQQQQSHCFPDQAGYELHHDSFNSFSNRNFPIQQVIDGYATAANPANPYRRHDDVALIANDNLASVAKCGGLMLDTTATNTQYEQRQQILFGHEQTHSFEPNNDNDRNSFSMMPPPPPPSLIDDGDLTVAQAQSYFTPCEFIDGEPANQLGTSSLLSHQVAQSSDGSLPTNLDSGHVIDTEKSVYVTVGAFASRSDDQTLQTRQYNFQYSTADQQSLEESTRNDQPPVVKNSDLMMNHRFGPEQQITRVAASSQQDYIDMRSSGNLSQEWLDTICRQMIEHMDSFGICVIDNFLGSIKGELILGEVKQLFSNRSYSTGRLVNDKLDSTGGLHASNDTAKTIRNDRVIWVDGCEKGCEEINNLIQTLCSVITNGSRLSLYSNNGLDKVVISKRTKAHVACYPGNGTRYIKHVDNPNGDGRVITAIYYLNKSWITKQDGGLLRMFPAGVETVANIEPLFDRVLFFWSDRRNPHEVLPAYRDRYAITVWYIGDHRSQET